VSLDLPENLPWVTLDTETSGLHFDDGARVACVALAAPGWSIALPFDQGVRDKFPTTQLDLLSSDVDPNLSRDAWEELCEWCTQQSIIFQNAKYDLHMMRAGTRHWAGVDLIDNFYWDTMLAQGILDPLHARGLDATADRLGFGGKVGLEAVKDWLKRRKYPPHRYDLVPWDIIRQYVTKDAIDTALIYENEQERLEAMDPAEAEHFYDRIERAFSLMRALYMMERRGIGYDDERSIQAAEMLEQRADEIEATMPFKVQPKIAERYFYDELGLEPAYRKSGENWKHVRTLDEEQVRRWRKDGVPWAEEFSLVTKIRRAVSMWYRGYPEKIGPDGRLRTSFKQGDVKSGRMSVERVQLQAMPKADKYNAVGSRDRLAVFEGVPDVRDLVRAEEGYGLWNLDLSQAELRVATRYSGCVKMAEQLANGIDSHGEVTNVLKVMPDDPRWKQQRDIAKRLNFGGIFMIGGETFQNTLAKLADIHLPVEDCEEYVRGWRQMYPEFEIAFKMAMRKFERDGYVRLLPKTPLEEKSYYNRQRDWPRTAWNRMVQGSLAVAFGYWLGEIERRWPGAMILTVHDSVVLECLLDEGDQIASEIAAFGAELMTDLFDTEMKVDTDRW
jgi:DNA polymerase I-like protein with 3'-5' exonuclease and polymerase domains